MSDTKERILLTALRLFARDEYEAVSASDIAGELGMTKGALYRHFQSKRDIFDSIVDRMYELDAQRSQEHTVPAQKYENDPTAYGDISTESVKAFTLSQFEFWTEHEFASDFRRMLTLEQYRSDEMAELYGSCIAEGPVSYMTDIFREMTARGILKEADPKLLAAEYYAPFFLLLSIADRGDKAECAVLLSKHIEGFFNTYEKHEET